MPSPSEVYDGTVKLLEDSVPGNGFTIGITEDVPEDRWSGNYEAIMNAIDDFVYAPYSVHLSARFDRKGI